MESNKIFAVNPTALIGGLPPTLLGSPLVVPLGESREVGLSIPASSSRDRLSIELDYSDLDETEREEEKMSDSLGRQFSLSDNQDFSPSFNPVPFVRNRWRDTVKTDFLTSFPQESSLVNADELAPTTSLKFVQDKHRNLKIFENGVQVEAVKGKQNRPVPNAFA